MNNGKIFTPQNLASFILIFMSVQFVGIEGVAVSIPKVVFMSISPMLILVLSPRISKAIVLSIIFWGTTFLLQIIQYEHTRVQSLYYTSLFLSTFCLFYNLVWEEHCYKIDDFLYIIKIVIYSYAGCVVLQQLFLLMGIKQFLIINLIKTTWTDFFHLNSLAIEPSHTARILTVYFYAFLKLVEYSKGRPIRIKEMFSEYRLLVFAFLYTMFVIGSATAMVGLVILSLYFLKKQYIVFVLFVFIVLYNILPKLDYEPLNRAIESFDATMTLDEATIIKADNSAAARINTLVQTLKYTDLTDIQLWLGYGEEGYWEKKEVTHPIIYIYGLLSYFLKLLLFYSCSFCGFFSLSTLLFVIMFSLNIGNIYYGFASLMVFSAIKYFQHTESHIY